MNPKVYILTAVHNSLSDTKIFLEHLSKQTYKNIETFIVDDGSTDGTENYIKKNFPKTKLIIGDGDWWWTKSLNEGIKQILNSANNNDYVWIINNDCYFDKDTIKNLVACSRSDKNRKTILGSIVLDSKSNNIIDSGLVVDWKKLNFLRFDYKISNSFPDALSTKGTLFPVCVFKNVGLFDEVHFPHYFSDYEFTIRAKRDGYLLDISDKTRVYNRIERTGIESFYKSGSFGKMLEIVFSKKSKFNLYTQICMIKYVCPKECQFNNYLLLFKKIIINIFKV
jgi:GT2 family glycosyltransferase